MKFIGYTVNSLKYITELAESLIVSSENMNILPHEENIMYYLNAEAGDRVKIRNLYVSLLEICIIRTLITITSSYELNKWISITSHTTPPHVNYSMNFCDYDLFFSYFDVRSDEVKDDIANELTNVLNQMLDTLSLSPTYSKDFYEYLMVLGEELTDQKTVTMSEYKFTLGVSKDAWNITAWCVYR